jgi:hypothetical protein
MFSGQFSPAALLAAKIYVMSQKPYWQQRREMKLTGRPTRAEEKKEKKEKSDFFANSIKQAPDHCQNCKKPLAPTKAISKAAVVAHILPKSKKQGVPSMATHEMNKVFLCGNCHTNMDNQGCDFILTMSILPLLRTRVAVMWPEIPANERRRVPECLRPAKD